MASLSVEPAVLDFHPDLKFRVYYFFATGKAEDMSFGHIYMRLQSPSHASKLTLPMGQTGGDKAPTEGWLYSMTYEIPELASTVVMGIEPLAGKSKIVGRIPIETTISNIEITKISPVVIGVVTRA